MLSPSARTSFTRVDVGAEGEVDGYASGPTNVTGSEGEVFSTTSPVMPQIPQVSLTFLTVCGKRRTMSFEAQTTIGQVKELVCNAWPNGMSISSLMRRSDVVLSARRAI